MSALALRTLLARLPRAAAATLVLVIVLGTGLARADAGAEAYRRGDLAGARSAWSDALAAEPAPPASERARLCYDLGNVAFREQRYAEAAGWYTAALRLRPRDADAWTNLELARSEAGLEPADRGDLAATLARLVGMWTVAESEWLVLAALGVWALALGWEALRGGRLARRAAWLGLGLVVLASLPALRHAFATHQDPLFVLPKDGAELTSEPREGAPKIARAAGGSVVERLDALPGWTQVALDEGSVGWVRADELFALER